MSGQTYRAVIRTPTREELARQAAIEAKGQEGAGATSSALERASRGEGQLETLTLQAVLARACQRVLPVVGTTERVEDGALRGEVAFRGTRVPLEIRRGAGGGELHASLSFADATGLTCAEEATWSGDFFALMAATAAPRPTPDDTTAANAPASQRREAR